MSASSRWILFGHSSLIFRLQARNFGNFNRNFNIFTRKVKAKVTRLRYNQKKPIQGPLYASIRTCFHPGVKNSSQLPLKYTRVQTFFKLLPHFWPKGDWATRRRVLLVFGLLLGAIVATVYVPLFFRDICNYYHHKNPEFVYFNFNTPGNAILTTGSCLILAYGATRATAILLSELRNVLFNKIVLKSARVMSRNVFLHLHSLDHSFHLSRQTGALSQVIEKGTRGMSLVLSSMVSSVIPAVFEISLVSVVYWHTLGHRFTFVILGSLGMYAVATLAITHYRTRFRHRMNQAESDAGNQALNSLINYEVVKYFNNEKFEASRYEQFLKNYEEANQGAASSLALLNVVQNTIFSAGLIGIMYFAAKGMSEGSLTVGDMVFANTLFFQLSVPMNFLGSMYRDVRQGLLDTSHMLTLLDFKPKVAEEDGARPLPVEGGYSAKFDNVRFGYAEGKDILNGLTMDIPAGKRVAIVGGSGSGKSTIVRLLYRLYDCDQGKITVNGLDIREATLSSVRGSVSLIPQTSILFNDSIFNNISYGNPYATERQVRDAATMAGLDPLVLLMPDRYETVIGKRGVTISREKRLRIAIARAILKNSSLLIYDEATSALDARTQASIMKTLKEAVRGRTKLIIAHRLASIKDADLIYALEQGRVAEKGKHDELLQMNGVYADLWRAQDN